ncbi:MAG: hypothetical protein ABL912_10915 [Novosphingobium sp.]
MKPVIYGLILVSAITPLPAKSSLTSETLSVSCYMAYVDKEAVKGAGSDGDWTAGDYYLIGIDIDGSNRTDTDKVAVAVFDPNHLISVKPSDGLRPKDGKGFYVRFGEGDTGWTFAAATNPNNSKMYSAMLIPNKKPKKADDHLGFMGYCGSEVPEGLGSNFDRIKAFMPHSVKRPKQ